MTRLPFRRTAALVVFSISFFGSAGSAWASTGLTAEQETNLYSFICVTIASAIVTAVVSLRYYWRSKLEDWMIILQSMSSVSIVTFACFLVGLLPLLRLLPIPDAMFHLYVPTVVLSFLLMSTSLWIRTLMNEQLPVLASVDYHALEYHRVQKALRLYMRDRRIARSKHRWAKKQALAERAKMAKAAAPVPQKKRPSTPVRSNLR